ncbi:hypothetical protein [Dendrosporobacter sp. 1207_IL3150]|uniref:hypothetical protein n=1 Tax=Dendrosporobacter sp. 1207_IL3150 TaxID=3084054 RepID=UPI002FDB4F49
MAIFSKNGGKRQAPVITVVPGAQTMNACYFLCQLQPAIAHGLKELNATNTRHVIIETAMISYLLGMGFDYRTALAIVETWESDNSLLAQGILVE